MCVSHNRELREEFAEEPTEIRDYSRLFSGEVYDRAHQERKLRYEEDHFTRLQETKQEKKQKKMRKFRCVAAWAVRPPWWFGRFSTYQTLERHPHYSAFMRVPRALAWVR